ncbi:P-loop containing nucleoside triphosphate hydrolase protein [Sphaerosporella brunnea]|uniref:P-loop containing nucleoside triphosphate hydrolase protein n=1 Tax=Sphaerosporella brunnea TaxID=1250544 RepID=A0A5J5F0Y1_9PEZI|nr:P-loop containing nucleoside triphosphate hydrolase protein [Sphaerosporella brunnea]
MASPSPGSAAPQPLHIEARLLPSVTFRNSNANQLSVLICKWLHKNFQTLLVEDSITSFGDSEVLSKSVDQLFVSEIVHSTVQVVRLKDVQLHVHVYQLHENKASEAARARGVPSGACRILDLPAQSLEGLWDSLMFEPGLKSKLLGFVSSLSFFADKKVNFMNIGFNRIILLHGPPGTGKTSFARALAQKLSIRLSNRYSECQLMEINSHNLFSKYFSESATLVGQLFDKIDALLVDSDLFLVILIDEVETLIPSRQTALNANDPTDGLRVVNAILTGLDKLRSKANVIVLTTSNLIHSLDPAFLDRADIKQFVDTPSTAAAYSILRNGLQELVRVGIITEKEILPCSTEASLNLFRLPDASSTRLWNCASKCVGFSGRELGKMLILMHALHLQQTQYSFREALNALEKTVEEKVQEKRQPKVNGGDSKQMEGSG